MVSSQAQPVSSVRVRSPNYPVLDLRDAVQKVRTVYQKQNVHPASRDVIAKVLGYAGLNGASGGVVSTLVKYGLMEQAAGDQIKVSGDGLDVVVHRKGDPEYAAVIERAAFRPTLFRELHDQYGHSLPSDHTLRANLLHRQFNPKVVDSVIRVYRDTLEFVDAETEGVNAPQGQDMDEPQMQTPETVDTGESRSPVLSPSSATTSVAPATALNERVITVALEEGSHARVSFPSHATQDDVDLVVAILNLNKRKFPKETIHDEEAE